MVKYSIFLFAFVSLIISCKRENPNVENATPVGEKNWVKTESGTKSEELMANSASEGDVKGMMTKSLQTLQSGFTASKGKVPGLDDVTVLIDDNMNLLIENKSGFTTTTTQVNLKNLDADMQNVEVLSDANPDNKFPGFRIKVLPGKAKVEVMKGGTKTQQDYLEIIHAERGDVIHSLSALTMAAQIAQNTLPIGVD